MFNKNFDEMQPSTSNSESSKRAKPYSIDELKDINKLHQELGIGNLTGNKSHKLWIELNDRLDAKYGKRSLQARQHQYHNKIKKLNDGELELHKKKSKSTCHYENFTAAEMLDIKRLHYELKVNETGIGKIEMGKRWSSINEELDLKYGKRDKSSRQLKFCSFIK